jgi:hypothetical protein
MKLTVASEFTAQKSVDQSRKGEWKGPRAGAGRSGRAPTGRTEVFNTKLRPEFRAKLFSLAKERGIGVAVSAEEHRIEVDRALLDVPALENELHIIVQEIDADDLTEEMHTRLRSTTCWVWIRCANYSAGTKRL